MKFLIVAVILFLYKILSNTYYYFRAKKLYDIFLDSFLEKSEFNVRHVEYLSQMKNIIRRAGIEDNFIYVSVPLGFGQVANSNASVFNNLLSPRADIAKSAFTMFNDAIGTYRARIFESINFFYWVELFIFLPKNIFKYLGFGSESKGLKVSQIAYWILAFFYSIYASEINEMIRTYLSNFSK